MIVNAKLSTFSIIHTGFGKKIWIGTVMNWKQHYQNNWNFRITSKSAAITVYYYECSWMCRLVLNVQKSLKIGHLANIFLKTASVLVSVVILKYVIWIKPSVIPSLLLSLFSNIFWKHTGGVFCGFLMLVLGLVKDDTPLGHNVIIF